MFISYRSSLVELLGSLVYTIVLSENNDTLTSSFLICISWSCWVVCIEFTSSVCVCVCVCLHACTPTQAHNGAYGSQRTIFKSWLSLSTIWVLEIELRPSDLLTGGFNYWALLLFHTLVKEDDTGSYNEVHFHCRVCPDLGSLFSGCVVWSR